MAPAKVLAASVLHSSILCQEHVYRHLPRLHDLMRVQIIDADPATGVHLLVYDEIFAEISIGQVMAPAKIFAASVLAAFFAKDLLIRVSSNAGLHFENALSSRGILVSMCFNFVVCY